MASSRLGIIDGGENPIKVRLLFEPKRAVYIPPHMELLRRVPLPLRDVALPHHLDHVSGAA